MSENRAELTQYECPFTWNMDEFVKKVDLRFNNEDHDEENDVPILMVMRKMMKVYEGVVQDDFGIVERNLKQLKETMVLLDENYLQSQHISKNIVDHVLNATIYHVARIMNDENEAAELEDKLKKLVVLNKVEKSTLDGCKSIAWSTYHYGGSEYAVQFAQSAASNSQCPVWHFLLGLNLRRARRADMHQISEPLVKEQRAFCEAYEKSRNPTFGIALAQCHRELGLKEESRKMYYDILESEPRSCWVRCRLALGLMLFKDYEAAKICLNYVENRNPNDPMFLHYKGLFFRRQERYNEALYYFKKAGKSNNFTADMCYVELIYKLHPEKNLIDQYKVLLPKYEKQENNMQFIYLAMAVYSCTRNDYENAMCYFLKGIEIKPSHFILKKFSHKFLNYETIDVYAFLSQTLLPKIAQDLDNINEENVKIYNTLKDMCKNVNNLPYPNL